MMRRRVNASAASPLLVGGRPVVGGSTFTNNTTNDPFLQVNNQYRGQGDWFKAPAGSATEAEKIRAAKESNANVEMQRAAYFTKEWLEAEIEKGIFNSPFIFCCWFIGVSYVGYHVFTNHIFPAMQTNWRPDARMAYQGPLTEEHNTFFNMSSTPGRHSEQGKIDPRALLWDETIDRPDLLASVPSEQYNQYSDVTGNKRPPAPGERKTELVAMEQLDYDPMEEADYHYRSLHRITSTVQEPRGADAPPRAVDQDKLLGRWKRAPTGGAADLRLGGMIRCKGISSTNNCIPDYQTFSQESDRKMLLGYLFHFLLRDNNADKFNLKLYEGEDNMRNPMQYPILYVGLGTGLVPGYFQKWTRTCKIDIVEPDAGVVKLAKRYFGFRDGVAGSRLFIEEPIEFLRKFAAEYKVSPKTSLVKEFWRPGTTTGRQDDNLRYKVIYLDCMTDETGRIPIKYSRLDFLQRVKDCLQGSGVVCANLPNDNDRIFKTVVENFRLAFEGKTVILVNCRTQPNTILLAFKDAAGWQEERFGAMTGVEDLHEIMRRFHHETRSWVGPIKFDMLSEVSETNFTQLLPGVSYNFDRGLRTAGEYSPEKVKDEYRKLEGEGKEESSSAPTQRKDPGYSPTAIMAELTRSPEEKRADAQAQYKGGYGSWFKNGVSAVSPGSRSTGGVSASGAMEEHLRKTPKEFDDDIKLHSGYASK